MRPAGEDVQVGRDAGSDEPPRVVDVLVQEAVEIADRDERGRQAGQFHGPRRNRVAGYVFRDRVR